MITYTHVQAVASATWTVAHGLNCYPACDTIAALPNGKRQKIIPFKVTYNDPNTITIAFTAAYAGSAAVAGMDTFYFNTTG